MPLGEYHKTAPNNHGFLRAVAANIAIECAKISNEVFIIYPGNHHPDAVVVIF